jgi:hypothetical protein
MDSNSLWEDDVNDPMTPPKERVEVKDPLLTHIEKLSDAYKIVFGDVAKARVSDIVLKDLEWFCYANRSTYHSDAREHALAEGRREVILRIRDWINEDVSTLVEMSKTAKTNR